MDCVSPKVIVFRDNKMAKTNEGDVIVCPSCGLWQVVWNGKTYYHKQNYKGKTCGWQFVANPEKKMITDEEKEKIEKLLLERISLRGICRVMDVSITWLLAFIADLYNHTPNDLSIKTEQIKDVGGVVFRTLETEADEMWSFVRCKENKQWIWIAIDAKTKQVVAFHVRDRSEESAKKLWEKIHGTYKKNSIFYADNWDAYKKVIPKDQHVVVDKGYSYTNILERFNCMLHQRASRLVRLALSFSKKIENHIGAIKYFIYHYNLSLSV